MNEHEKLLKELQKHFLLAPELIAAEDILQQLELSVSNLLEKDADAFFQLMYRLDISENKLTEALRDKENGVHKIALLIFERQLQKIRSRQERTTDKPKEDDLAW